ncbi:MAG: hypothetical protein FWF78_06450 [Defluviitaleaceae bacterium]|nr:hypothetical protein [Defluviitaleaceae bacterium]
MIKNYIKKEREKLREMTFAEKRWYIWEYYKLHIGGFILVAFLLGSFVYNRLNPSPDEYIYIAWVGIEAFAHSLESASDELSIIVYNPERERAFITDYSSTSNSEMDMALQTRFMALLQMGNIDAFIAPREGIDAFAEQGFVRPLSDVLPYVENRQVLYAIHDRIILIEDMYANTHFLAVSLQGSPFFARHGIGADDIYLGVVANSQRFYAIAKALEVILYDA